MSACVDQSTHVPDLFVLRFRDPDAIVLAKGLLTKQQLDEKGLNVDSAKAKLEEGSEEAMITLIDAGLRHSRAELDHAHAELPLDPLRLARHVEPHLVFGALHDGQAVGFEVSLLGSIGLSIALTAYRIALGPGVFLLAGALFLVTGASTFSEALTRSAAKRSPLAPGVPTVQESGIANFAYASWYGVWAPKGTPADAQQRMAEEIRKAIQSERLKTVWAGQGAEFPDMSQQQFGTFIDAEVKRWAQVVKASNVKAD